jgi:hypothetical protein
MIRLRVLMIPLQINIIVSMMLLRQLSKQRKNSLGCSPCSINDVGRTMEEHAKHKACSTTLAEDATAAAASAAAAVALTAWCSAAL